jgi:hypothetical protein
MNRIKKELKEVQITLDPKPAICIALSTPLSLLHCQHRYMHCTVSTAIFIARSAPLSALHGLHGTRQHQALTNSVVSGENIARSVNCIIFV